MLAHARITTLLPQSLTLRVFLRNKCEDRWVCLLLQEKELSFSVLRKNSDFGCPNSLVPFLPYFPKCPNLANPCLLKIRISSKNDPLTHK